MRKLLAAGLLLAAACGNIGSPEITSTQVYEFRDVVDTSLTVIFHWTRPTLPVRVWVAADSPIRGYVQTALDRWQGAFLYGEFRATIVADSSAADVIVRNAPSDIISGGFGRRAPQCVGETDPDFDLTARTVRLPMHVFVYAVGNPSAAALATCYSVTLTHEFGHVLGIMSPSHAGATSSDVMDSNPSFDGLSERDRLTAVILYSLSPTFTITGRP